MDLGRKNDRNSVITAAMVSMKVILFLLVVVVAYNLLSVVAAVYESPWYSSHFENDAAGLFVSSFLLLQLMFLLRFPKIRFLLLIAGFCGWVAMTIKLHMPPDAATSLWRIGLGIGRR